MAKVEPATLLMAIILGFLTERHTSKLYSAMVSFEGFKPSMKGLVETAAPVPSIVTTEMRRKSLLSVLVLKFVGWLVIVAVTFQRKVWAFQLL